MRQTMRSSEFHDVDRLWALVAVLLLEGDLGALAQRAVAVTVDAGEVDEEVAPTAVGRDEPEALLVREPLDRSGTHRTLTCCFGAALAPHSSTGRCVRSQTEQTLYTQPPGTQPARPHAAWRCLRGQLGGRRRDLVAVARRRVPGQPQRVAG